MTSTCGQSGAGGASVSRPNAPADEDRWADAYARYVTEPLPPAAVDALRRSLQDDPPARKMQLDEPAAPDQAYYHSPEWQADEVAAVEELECGEGLRFENMGDAIRWLADGKES